MTNNVANRLTIQDILTRYAAAIDDRSLKMYHECFAEDAETLRLSGGTEIGADAWATEAQNKLEAFGATQHTLGPQIVTTKGDTASNRADAQALHYLKEKPAETISLWAV